jgi:serine/threonine protein kinase
MSLRYRDNINEEYNLKNLSKCIDLVNKQDFKKINEGQQGEIFKAYSKDCGSVVIKKKLIKEEHNKWKNNVEWLKEQLIIEYKIMLLTKRMITENICPNFIMVYDYNEKNNLIIMEYADGDSRFLFKNEFYDDDIYKSYLCQVLFGIYAFNNYTMLYHRDIKPDNILYKKINKNIILHYKINDKDYYVPTFGYLFMIGDFGSVKFILSERVEDIINFDYFIIKNYLINLSSLYPSIINQNHVNNMNNVFYAEKDKIHLNLNKMLELSNIIKDKKDKKINNYIFEFHKILTSSKNILNIVDKYFNDFTKNKNNSNDNIVDFVLDF